MANRMGKGESSDRFPLLGLKNHCGLWLQPWNQKTIASWQESDDKTRQCVEKQRHYSANTGPYSQGFGVFSGHIWLWELDRKEGRTPKNWCLWTVVLEKTPESPMDSREIKLANLKGDQPWIFTGRTDAEAEAPVFWSPDANSQLIGKVPGKDWGQKEKRASEDEMAGQHHWCSEHEFGQTPGAGKGEGGLPCCSPWGRKESDTTGELKNNSNNNQCVYYRSSLVSQMVKNPPEMQETWVQSWVRKILWRREWLYTPVLLPREVMDIGSQQATVYGVVKNWTQSND